jgi:hypothetical protein
MHEMRRLRISFVTKATLRTELQAHYCCESIFVVSEAGWRGGGVLNRIKSEREGSVVRKMCLRSNRHVIYL